MKALGPVALIVVFLGVRLAGLTALPVCAGEGVAIDCAAFAGGRHAVFSDGGQYVPVVLLCLVVARSRDPLWGARSVAVVCGLAVALAFAYDRLATAEALFAALVVWGLPLTVATFTTKAQRAQGW